VRGVGKVRGEALKNRSQEGKIFVGREIEVDEEKRGVRGREERRVETGLSVAFRKRWESVVCGRVSGEDGGRVEDKSTSAVFVKVVEGALV
jgi:hypothetical protein